VEGIGELRASIDGGEPRTIAIDRPRLHLIAEHERHEAHRLTLAASEGLRVWSLSFGAGLP
jgi:hypothetical protein